MNKIKGKLGFGCMRFPVRDGKIDYEHLSEMIDTFIERGFNYFDTAHGYMRGESESALRECLVKRYPRESFLLANKLSTFHFEKREEIRPLFESQLIACGVDYFDFYLMHAQNKVLYKKYTETGAYEEALALMREGKFRHFGISFHDDAELLEKILTEHPEVELVQLQINYADYDDAAIQGRACLEVCKKYGKGVIVMEPVKGGALVKLPDEAKAVFDSLGDASYASYAIRFAASLNGVLCVLSGMSDMEQVLDNTSYMQSFTPLSDAETAAIERVKEIFASQNLSACTACRYCTDGCPKNISIPDLFACMNAKKSFRGGWNADYYYNSVHTSEGRRASDCIGCGKCELACPQKLEIRKLLRDVANEFENKSKEA
jgi:predicted aldo/keto reductase-like oxidoreductase